MGGRREARWTFEELQNRPRLPPQMRRLPVFLNGAERTAYRGSNTHHSWHLGDPLADFVLRHQYSPPTPVTTCLLVLLPSSSAPCYVPGRYGTLLSSCSGSKKGVPDTHCSRLALRFAQHPSSFARH